MLNAAISLIVTRTRDLLGYAGSPPDPRWPGGARVAVSIVINFEEGAEFAIDDGITRMRRFTKSNSASLADPIRQSTVISNTVRLPGWWRIMEVLGQHGAPARVSSRGRGAFLHPRARGRRKPAGAKGLLGAEPASSSGYLAPRYPSV
jgi:hypothetical protein